MTHFIDIVLTLLALTVPAYLAVRFNLIGVLAGGLLCWLTLLIAGEALSALDPGRSRLLDLFWLRVGWLAGLTYCASIYGVKRIYCYRRVRRRTAG